MRQYRWLNYYFATMKHFMLNLEKIILFLLLAALLCVGILLLLQPKPAAIGATATPASLQENFAKTAETALRSVVVIKTGKTISGYPEYHDPREALYEHFYGSRTRSQITTGQGSGFIIRPDGHILTNYHIINNQDFFTVVMPDGKEVEAVPVGADPYSDLAVIKINLAEHLPALEFADTNSLRVGHWAVAVGAPFSLAHTVTAGIISHKKRSVGLNLHENFIQTAASVNPGNSGGPLLNLDGKVIGVNDFILSPTSGNIGLSFAIDGNLAHRIANDLIEHGQVSRPWLGVITAGLTPAAKNRFNIKSGVLVTGIYAGSPAFQCGLRGEDIITELNGNQINGPNELSNLIFDCRPGQKVKIKFLREGKIIETEALVTTIPRRLRH